MSEPTPAANTMVVAESKTKKKKKSKKKSLAATAPASDGAAGTAAATTASPTTTTAAAADAAVTDGQEPAETDAAAAAELSEHSEPEDSDARPPPASTDTSVYDDSSAPLAGHVKQLTPIDDPTKRLDDLIRDRDDLRAEVSLLRQSLEQLQAKHREEMDEVRAQHHTELEDVQAQLQESQDQKDQAVEQYETLVGRVNTLKSQLGERLKGYAEELEQARTRIEELEEERTGLQERDSASTDEIQELKAKLQEQSAKVQEQSKELSSLRNRATLSQQNWNREREELIESEAYLREEFENAKQAMQDWETLAVEERARHRVLADRVADLEEQVTSTKESYDSVKADRDGQSTMIEGLQKNLQELQSIRRTELKELVESSQAELDGVRKQLEEAEAKSATLSVELDQANKERERLSPFEKEVKEKQLLIGKLKHEAVILNDHLTKALRFLKKGKADDNVDRHIVTSYLLQFLALDRSDAKKFQVLQLIAALLGWTEEEKERAGLARPGGASTTHAPFGSIRSSLAAGSVHRTPSTPSLTRDYFPETASPASKETLAELWQNFLEQEASNATSPLSPRGRLASTASQSTSTGGGTLHP